MIRAHLIMNPEARRVSPALLHVVTAALEARLKLEVTETHARDAAVEVARQAAASGTELMIAFGGDGLVNEVVNGMAGSDATLAIIPGGTMNVFARTLGLPVDPLDATDLVLRRAGGAEPRRMVLGRANERYFTFACGCGFDAEAAARVEAHKAAKRRWGEPYFYAAAVATFLGSYLTRKPFLRCEASFGVEEGVMAIGLAAGPYAYLAGWPVRLSRTAASDGKLRLFLLRRLEVLGLPSYAFGSLTGRFGPGALSLSGLEEYTVTSGGPVPYHVDGEPLEPASRIHVRIAPMLLKVLV